MGGIVEEAAKLKAGFLLDVASGRGMLLRELLKNVDANVEIISTDLSFRVLWHDRIKFRQINPHIKVNYIACDATNLPIQDHSIDMACTYLGFANMVNLMENGIRDTARVLKDRAPLINSLIYMDENADGAKKVAKYLSENHMEDAQKIYIRDELLAIHTKYFRNLYEKNIYEGIVEGVEGDLFPCAGEWLQMLCSLRNRIQMSPLLQSMKSGLILCYLFISSLILSIKSCSHPVYNLIFSSDISFRSIFSMMLFKVSAFPCWMPC